MPKKRRRTPGSGPDQVAPEVGLAPGGDSAEAAGSAAEFTGDPSAPASSGALPPGDEPVVRRTADGWRVGDDELPDLTCAMVLADLLAAELPTDIQPAVPAASAQPPRDEPVAEEARRLRTTIGQLEHALTARIRIEQAIGVLAERHRIRPRQAFEQLRTAARNRGRKVIDIATDVVASASNPLLQLPEELSRQRSAPRHAARNPRRVLRSE
jgi:ANTAR domain-containing protein